MTSSSRRFVILWAIIIIFSLGETSYAVNMIDMIVNKEAKLKTGTRILVNRLTGQVSYYWQQGYRWGDQTENSDEGGMWKVPAPGLKSTLQKQYNSGR